MATVSAGVFVIAASIPLEHKTRYYIYKKMGKHSMC